MNRVWTEEERESCRAEVSSDNPWLTGIELQAATDMHLKFVEEWDQRLLYGDRSPAPVGLFGYT